VAVKLIAGGKAVSIKPDLTTGWLDRLIQQPTKEVGGHWAGAQFIARIISPNFHTRLREHYAAQLDTDIYTFCQRVQVPVPFDQYGVELAFTQATELNLHNTDLVLDETLRQIMDRVGPVIIKNAYLDADIRQPSHRNRFPHLNFHIDRTPKQVTVYSMYTRDPFDEEQKHPRTSSTLFTPFLVVYLQAVKEGLIPPGTATGLATSYVLFTKEDMSELLGNLVLEHRWDEPEGVGEISMQDNRNQFHSSYYRDASMTGYKISVRYLADSDTIREQDEEIGKDGTHG
jgi:hypothetical protein